MKLGALFAGRRDAVRDLYEEGSVGLAQVTAYPEVFAVMRPLQAAARQAPPRSERWFLARLDLAWGAHLLAADRFAQRLLLDVLSDWPARPAALAGRHVGVQLQLAQAFYYTRRYDLAAGFAYTLMRGSGVSVPLRMHARLLQIRCLVRQGRSAEAEDLLLESSGLPTPLESLALALVRLGQGYAGDAVTLAERALAEAATPAPAWQWRILAELHSVAAEAHGQLGNWPGRRAHAAASRAHNGGRALCLGPVCC